MKPPLTTAIVSLLTFASVTAVARENTKNVQKHIETPSSRDLIFSSEAVLSRAPNLHVRKGALGSVPILHLLRGPCAGELCGDQLCCCSGNTASCVGQGLRYIPALPSKITRLDFSDNALGRVDNDTLRNLTSLEFLSLERNEIDFIHPDAFVLMRDLRELRLGINNLTDFDHLLSRLRPAESLQFLNASGNRFWNLTLSNLTDIPNLKRLVLYGNHITKIAQGERGKKSKLETLDLSSNLLQKFPDFCRKEAPEESFLPYLHTLDVQWNIITIMHSTSAKCLPALKNLNLGGNAIHHIRKNFLQGLPALENLSLQFCMSRQIDSHAFNHSNLQYLNVSENLWFFDSHYGSGISKDLFVSMPRLHFVNMSWTVFRFSRKHERHSVLSSVKHVKEFVLEGTGIDYIPHTILAEFVNLTSLSLSRNQIALLADNTFENLTSLRSLDLSENHLTFVSQRLLEDILRRTNVSINLSGNPFSCTCDLLWFIEEYKADADRKEGRRFVGNGPYVCNGPDSERHKNLADADISRHKCVMTEATYVAILFSTTVIIVLLIVASLVYRFRWQLRFMLYSLQHRLSRDGNSAGPVGAPKYDIFVSYDSSDSQWVLDTLRPELEERRGLTLCLHERDFTPGMFISHNIIEKMEESGTILPVLSKAFLHSAWCRFELFLAVKNGFQRPSSAAERRIAMLPVLLEDLQQEDVDSLVCAVLSTTTYLAWPGQGDREEKERFWNTLCSVLNRGRRGRELGLFPPV